MMRSALPRVTLTVLALVLVAWFAVLFRDDRIGQAAATRLHEDAAMSDAEWARNIEQLRDADLLNPGTEWKLTRAAYLYLRDKRAALRVAESVLRQEPDNLNAWNVVVRAARGIDPQRAAEARAEIARLNPVPDGR